MWIAGQLVEHVLVEHDRVHGGNLGERREAAIVVAEPPPQPGAPTIDGARRDEEQIGGSRCPRVKPRPGRLQNPVQPGGWRFAAREHPRQLSAWKRHWKEHVDAMRRRPGEKTGRIRLALSREIAGDAPGPGIAGECDELIRQGGGSAGPFG